MQEQIQPGMQCAEVEALLAEALDGALHGPTLAAFEAHEQSCAACRSMVEEARAGMHLLEALEEAEPPRNLVHNILAQTIGALPSEHAVAKPRGEGRLERFKARLAPIFAGVATPRFAMSFGMAFFSITMLLGIAGFHFADVRNWDLSSKGITKAYYATEARVMRYYENMRVVYEIESRVRDLRHAATPDNSQDIEQQQQPPQQQQPAPAPKNSPKSEMRRHDSNQEFQFARFEFRVDDANGCWNVATRNLKLTSQARQTWRTA
jgi:Putative zinc-finger